MAHKLKLGSVLGACVLLAGCQQTGGSRFASNQSGIAQPVMAKQKAPQPVWPTTAGATTGPTTAATTGAPAGPAGSATRSPGFNTSTAAAQPNSSSANPFPIVPATANTAATANGANSLPPLPGDTAPLGPTTTTNRNVTLTAPPASPAFPSVPGAPSAPPPLSQPGITPLEQP
jgi:hypothetical protein